MDEGFRHKINGALFDRIHALHTDRANLPAWHDHMKRLLVVAWRALPKSTRRLFIERLDSDLNILPPHQKTHRQEQEELTFRIIQGWKLVLASCSKADRGFALSVMKKRGDPTWWPSEAQEKRMRAMWRDVGEPDDVDIVEKG